MNAAGAPRRLPVEPARSLQRFLLFAGVVLAVGCLYWARVVLIPVALAILLAFLLSPVVALVRRAGLPQVPSVMLVVTLALLLAGGLGWALLTQVTTFAHDLPRYRATIARKVSDVQHAWRGGAMGDGAARVNWDGPWSQVDQAGPTHPSPTHTRYRTLGMSSRSASELRSLT